MHSLLTAVFTVKIGVLLCVFLNSILGCCSGCHGNIGVKQVFHRNCLVFGPEINWLP